MGKSSKKRRKERQRQERLNELSTFGSLIVSSKGVNGGTAVNEVHSPNQSQSQSHDELSDSQTHGTDRQAVVLVANGLTSRDENIFKDMKVDSFGSASIHVRTLPTVAFVYPRNKGDDHERYAPKSYVFGQSDEMETDVLKNRTTESSHSDHTTLTCIQSIDDILNQKVRAVVQQQDESTGTIGGGAVGHGTDFEVDRKIHSPHDEPKHREPKTSLNTKLHQHTESTHHILPYLSGISVAEAVRDKAGLRPRANSTDGELKLPQRGLCDEQKVLASFKWRSDIGTNSRPKGFNNLGNTCFLNSTLQCLAYCPPFCQSLMNMPRSDNNQPSATNKMRTKVNQGRNFTLILAALFRRVHNAENTKGALSPRILVNTIPLLGSGSTRRNGYKFRPGRQEDAHEFLVHLLDAMNDGELREAGINANKSGWRDRLPVPRLDETTFVHRIFGGYLRSQVCCTDCGYRSNTYDPFLDLSLEISRNSCHSLSAAINEFTRKETLDSQNRWKCSVCKKKVCATKQLTVFRPPLSLCVQLKRFAYGGSSSGFRNGGKKISKPIEFPAQLQLPLSDGRSCGYVLTGIVIHIGGSASSGHYTAFVQRPSSNGDRKWFHMDDSFVQPVSEQHVLRQHNAYVIMYCRQEVRVEFPTPPLRGSMTADEAMELTHLRQKAKSKSTSGTTAIKTQTYTNRDDLSSNKDHSSNIRSSPSEIMQTFAANASHPISSVASEAFIAPETKSKTDDIGKEIMSIDRQVIHSMKVCKHVDADISPSGKGTNGLKERVKAEEAKIEILVHEMPIMESTERENSRSEFANNTGNRGSNQTSLIDVLISTIQTDDPMSSHFSTTNVNDVVNGEPGENSTADRSLLKIQSKLSKAKLSCASINRGDGGNVQVVMRSQLKNQRAWIPKIAHGQNDEEFVLLGNIPVSKWNDDEDNEMSEESTKQSGTFGFVDRDKIAKEIQSVEQERKRKMFLDRHDSMLDQGKTKKVKSKKVPIFQAHPSTPSLNAFQRIQGLKQNLTLKRRS